MTPKEALNQLNNFISREKHIDSERNKTINKCVDTLSQAIDHLEQLEIADRNNQNLVKTNVELVNENLELQKENQELETDKKMLNALYQEVKDTASFYMSKCEKLKKVIDILKDKFNFELDKPSPNGEYPLVYENYQSGIGRLAKLLAQQEYDLLKEMLESV